jgi:recombination protein RecA
MSRALSHPAGLPSRRPAVERWGLDALAGRLGELSARGGSSRLSLAFGVVAEAQRRGEPAAWINGAGSAFYPPDAVAAGVSLERLPVVFAPDPSAAARAADKLARSGAFGLIVLDLAGRPGAVVPQPLLTRLVGLAQQHGTALLFLTDKPAEEPSLGSLVALRCEAQRQPAGEGSFLCVARALKDKCRGPGWSWSEVRRGPLGLR